MAEVGVSIQHDANHGAFSRRSWVGALFGATLDAVGASSFMWRQQHMGGHHVHTNVDGLDPDIRVSDADVRRVTPYQPWHHYQVPFTPHPPPPSPQLCCKKRGQKNIRDILRLPGSADMVHCFRVLLCSCYPLAPSGNGTFRRQEACV